MYLKSLQGRDQLTSWYHTTRPGVLGVEVVDVVGQLCAELSVIDGEASKMVMRVMILMMKTIYLGSVQLTIGPTVFWSLHSPSCTVLS